MDAGSSNSDNAAAAAPEVAWIRLKGHTMNIAKSDRQATERFLENLKQSNLFEISEDKVVSKVDTLYTGTSKINNVTSFVIYLKLKNTIKQ